MRSDDALLLDMLIAARKAERFLATMSLAEFQANELAQSAVIRELQVIGEAARLVSEATISRSSGVDWRTISGMRNRLVHEYFSIRLDVVWQTVHDDIPSLIVHLEHLVPAENPSDSADQDLD